MLHCCLRATTLLSMTNTRWWNYVEELVGDDNFSQAANKAGFDKSAFTRWKRGAAADPAFVVKLARGYDANVLHALVESGFLTEQEAALTEVSPRLDLTDIPGPDLMSEVERRLEELRFLVSLSPARDDLASRRPTPDVQDEPYAANRRKPEPEEGDDDFGPGA